MTKLIDYMQLDKLRALRQRQHRIVSTWKMVYQTWKKSQLIKILYAKAEIIRVLNEKIINHNDIDDIAGELHQTRHADREIVREP